MIFWIFIKHFIRRKKHKSSTYINRLRLITNKIKSFWIIPHRKKCVELSRKSFIFFPVSISSHIMWIIIYTHRQVNTTQIIDKRKTIFFSVQISELLDLIIWLRESESRIWKNHSLRTRYHHWLNWRTTVLNHSTQREWVWKCSIREWIMNECESKNYVLRENVERK